MKKINYLFVLGILLLTNSCGVFNRMTSPETLKQEERTWTVGVAVDPQHLTKYFQDEYNDPIFGVQPVVGYRSGLKNNQDIGVTLYGVFTPSLVIDYKHQLLQKNNFLLSGDAAVYGGYLRPSGLQYDLIFGKKQFYGVVGASYDFAKIINEAPFMSFGIGSEGIGNSGLGIQIAYARSFSDNFYLDYTQNLFSVGIKFDFLKTKKKFRK